MLVVRLFPSDVIKYTMFEIRTDFEINKIKIYLSEKVRFMELIILNSNFLLLFIIVTSGKSSLSLLQFPL